MQNHYFTNETVPNEDFVQATGNWSLCQILEVSIYTDKLRISTLMNSTQVHKHRFCKKLVNNAINNLSKSSNAQVYSRYKYAYQADFKADKHSEKPTSKIIDIF
jgi:hypothetical protein